MALGAPVVSQCGRKREVSAYKGFSTTTHDAESGRTLLERRSVDSLVQVNGVFTGDDVVQGGPGLLGL